MAEEEKKVENEKEDFLKRLEEKTNELKSTEERIKNLVERNEELAARKLLGGNTDAGKQPEPVKEETPKEYIKRVMSGDIKLEP